MTPFDKYDFFKLSIIDDNIDNVFRNFRQYLSDKADDFKSSISRNIDFDLICDKPYLDYNGDFKFMLFEPLTNPKTTIFFSNARDGWYTAVYNYARLYKKDIFQIGFPVDKNLKNNPAYFFTKFQYNDKSEFEQRVVHLIKENNWTFYENSDIVKPLFMENMEYYKSKRKTDRLNKEIIIEYLNKAGYDLTDKNFFQTNNNVYYCKWQ